MPSRVGSKLLLSLYADVRLHIPITHRTGRYVEEHEDRLTNAARVYFAQKGMESWVGTWLGFIGSVIVLCTSLLLALDPNVIDSGLAGMALSYALSSVMMLNIAVRYTSELEAKMNCVERIAECVQQC